MRKNAWALLGRRAGCWSEQSYGLEMEITALQGGAGSFGSTSILLTASLYSSLRCLPSLPLLAWAV